MVYAMTHNTTTSPRRDTSPATRASDITFARRRLDRYLDEIIDMPEGTFRAEELEGAISFLRCVMSDHGIEAQVQLIVSPKWQDITATDPQTLIDEIERIRA